MLNNKGQTLIEICFVLPVVLLSFSGILVCSYKQIAFFLTDHWVYEANLCLATNKPVVHCRKKLIQQITKIPFSDFYLDTFFKDRQSSKIILQTRESSFLKLRINEGLSLPLNSKDFKRFKLL